MPLSPGTCVLTGVPERRYNSLALDAKLYRRAGNRGLPAHQRQLTHAHQEIIAPRPRMESAAPHRGRRPKWAYAQKVWGQCYQPRACADGLQCIPRLGGWRRLRLGARCGSGLTCFAILKQWAYWYNTEYWCWYLLEKPRETRLICKHGKYLKVFQAACE